MSRFLNFVGAVAVAQLMSVDADAELFEKILEIIANQTIVTDPATDLSNDTRLDTFLWLRELSTIKKFGLLIKFVASSIRESIKGKISSAEAVEESLLEKYSE
jgi:hypothetical protein